MRRLPLPREESAIKRTVIALLLVVSLVMLSPPVVSLCGEYVAGPSASAAHTAAKRYGSDHLASCGLTEHAFVHVGESDDPSWGREYYYVAKSDDSVRFKIVSAFYWYPILAESRLSSLRFGADYRLERWEP